LTEAADAIGHGDLRHRVTVTAPTELATLAGAMNAMGADLSAAQEEREHRRREAELVAQLAATSTPRSTWESCCSGWRPARANCAPVTRAASRCASRIAT
jgi:HAMP domain